MCRSDLYHPIVAFIMAKQVLFIVLSVMLSV